MISLFPLILTGCPIRKHHLAGFPLGTERIEHGRPRGPKSICHEHAQAEPDQRADHGMGGHTSHGAAQRFPIRGLQVMLQVLLGQLGQVIAARFAEGGEGVHGNWQKEYGVGAAWFGYGTRSGRALLKVTLITKWRIESFKRKNRKRDRWGGQRITLAHEFYFHSACGVFGCDVIESEFELSLPHKKLFFHAVFSSCALAFFLISFVVINNCFNFIWTFYSMTLRRASVVHLFYLIDRVHSVHVLDRNCSNSSRPCKERTSIAFFNIQFFSFGLNSH